MCAQCRYATGRDGKKKDNKNMKDIYICTSTQAVGSRVNRHFADVAPHYVSIMHLCVFPVALARQWLMQPIQWREQLSLTLTKKRIKRCLSCGNFHIISHETYRIFFTELKLIDRSTVTNSMYKVRSSTLLLYNIYNKSELAVITAGDLYQEVSSKGRRRREGCSCSTQVFLFYFI